MKNREKKKEREKSPTDISKFKKFKIHGTIHLSLSQAYRTEK